jgi:hypothetical protein
MLAAFPEDAFNMNKDSLQSMGGKARAEALSDDKRKEIASKAAAARWNLPLAHFEGDLDLGKAKISCAVVEIDGEFVRLISSSGLMTALDRPWKGSYKANERPNFLQGNNLAPYFTEELESMLKMVEYRIPSGGTKQGYRAEIVPLVCEVYLQARDAGTLVTSQFKVAKACEIIMRSLAKLGIVALVDEATGYQKVRAKKALAEILEQFIAKELRAWTKTFPLEFYEQIFRLKKWPFDPESVKRPSCIGHYTNNIVYKRLAPGVLQTLRDKNPVIDGRRKAKHFQWLTGEVGDPKLRSHLDGVLPLMRISESWDQFKKYLDKAYPVFETTELGLTVEIRDP